MKNGLKRAMFGADVREASGNQLERKPISWDRSKYYGRSKRMEEEREGRKIDGR